MTRPPRRYGLAAFSAALIRLCQPGPVARNFSSTSASRRIVVDTFGAGNRGLLKALAVRGRDLCVIVHELTGETRGALESGVIDAVLNQDAGHEVRSAIRVLRAKADGLSVNAAQERIRLDIFIKDNLPPAGPDEE